MDWVSHMQTTEPAVAARQGDAAGALPAQRLRKLIAGEHIGHASIANVRPASLDLTISQEVYRVEHLFLPRKGESVRSMLPAIGAEQHHLMTPMEVGVTYLVRLNEQFALPPDVYGFCNPKSTTGRHDIHVRIVADGTARYDDLSPTGFTGEAWVVIVPRSYPIRLPPDTSLAQARFFTADTRLHGPQMEAQFAEEPLLYDENDAAYDLATAPRHDDGKLTLTLDLSREIAGYECLAPRKVLDLGRSWKHELATFFRPIPGGEQEIILREGRFYILSSYEHVRVPPYLACEMRPMDERYGDFRTHYAGFIDPGWGWGKAGEGRGRPFTLEVRPFENLVVRHQQPIALISFERMAETPDAVYDAIASSYTAQAGPQLAKQFL